jgi:Ca2+-binding RTX toxin-like protein
MGSSSVSGYGQNQIINLNGGTWSSIGGLVNNIGIYTTSLIENAVGGSGSDVITGNGANNILTGNAGNDRLLGGAGADTLSGGANSDVLIGDGPVSWDANGQAVRRLYIATLNRAPDDGGHQNWVASLEGGQSLQAIATGFINSTEFNTVYGALNNTQFVTTLYSNVLGRAPDAQGLANWVNMLNSGTSREAVVIGFSESTEFKTTSDPAAHVGQVFRMYDSAFNRQADTGGFENWVTSMYGGAKMASVVTSFMNSAEFTNTYGNINSLTNTQFVTLLYNNVLNRAPDSGGLASWVGALDGGMSRADVFIGFSEATEHVNLMASSFDAFMRGSMNAWRDTLTGGSGNDVLTGGRGSDTFEFAAGDASSDTVYGFEMIDTLRLTGFGFSSAAQALAAMTQQGSHVVFSAAGNTITFHDTQISTLQSLSGAGWVFA